MQNQLDQEMKFQKGIVEITNCVLRDIVKFRYDFTVIYLLFNSFVVYKSFKIFI